MEMRKALLRTERTRVRRVPARASYDRELCHAILDEGLLAMVGIVADGQPFVLPMVYARDGDSLILHGSSASRLLRAGGDGTPLCVTVTLLDGLVLARSAFHHSMNYRSVMILGRARSIATQEDKQKALDLLLEHLCRGRSRAVRAPNPTELRATSVLSLPIEEASVKCRTGGPVEEPGDEDFPCWGGVVPLELRASAPISDAGPAQPLPNALADYVRRKRAITSL